jgi:outer membrane protein OmpA-like peptidoglycan-associated protein
MTATPRARRALHYGVLLGLVVSALSCARVPPPQAPGPADVVALLADPESRQVGRVVVSTAAGSVELDAERESTRVRAGAAPAPPTVLTVDEVQQLFGDALSAQPPEPRQFLLYFEIGTSTLTPASQALLPQILAFVRSLPTADVTVIGHTDRTDSAAANYTLALARATLIRDQLVAAGLALNAINATSHGEFDPLVDTPDNVAEARNRRVEVMVR